MNFENFNEQEQQKEEISVIQKFADSMQLSGDKKKKLVAILGASLFGISTGAYAVENNEAQNEMNYESESMKKIVELVKSGLSEKQSDFFASIAEKLQVDESNIINIVKKTSKIESFEDYHDTKYVISSDVPMHGDDIYMTAYSGTSSLEGTNDEWQLAIGETQLSSIPGKIETDGNSITIENVGSTENDAILHALSTAIIQKKGVISGDGYKLSETEKDGFFMMSASITEGGCIESYDVQSIEMNEYGYYVATIDVVFGKIVE